MLGGMQLGRARGPPGGSEQLEPGLRLGTKQGLLAGIISDYYGLVLVIIISAYYYLLMIRDYYS